MPSGPPEMGKRPLLWGTGGPGDEGAHSCPLWSPPTHARSHTHLCTGTRMCIQNTFTDAHTSSRKLMCTHARSHTLTTCTHITHTSTPSHASQAHTHPQWHRAPLPCKTGHPHTRLHPTSTGPAHRGAPGATPSEAPRKPAPPLRPDSRPTHHPLLSQGLWSWSRGGLSPGGRRGEGLLPTRSAWLAGGGLLVPRTLQRAGDGRHVATAGHRSWQEVTQMASSRGPQGSATTASPLAGGLPQAHPRDGRRPLHGAWGRLPRPRAEGGPTPAGCQARSGWEPGARGGGRSARHTEPRGGMRGVGAGQSQGRGPEQHAPPALARGPAGPR